MGTNHTVTRTVNFPNGKSVPYSRDWFARPIKLAARYHFDAYRCAQFLDLGKVGLQVAEQEEGTVLSEPFNDGWLAHEASCIARDHPDFPGAWRFFGRGWKIDGPWHNSMTTRRAMMHGMGLIVPADAETVPLRYRQ